MYVYFVVDMPNTLLKAFGKALFVVTLSVVLLTGCSQKPPTEQTISIAMTNFAFSPNYIEAYPGQTIKIELSSTEGAHNLMIPELGQESRVVGQGETYTQMFVIPDNAKGKEYSFHCSVGSHKDEGMTGKIVVL